MSLKVAFCGPNMELNESLAKVVKDLTYQESLEYVELANPMRTIADITKRETFFEGHEIDWMNLWSTSLRRMEIEGARNADVVTSASCGVDNVCMQAAWLGEQVEKAKTGLSLVDSKGEPMVGESGVWINRSGAVLQAIMNSAEEEVFEHWDFVYAVMPVAMEMSKIQEVLLYQYADFLKTVPAFQSITHLPDNLEAATDALKNEVDEWKSQLTSQ